MSEYERSYYEIALTNGQVMTVFGVLLALVSGAFVAGMWVAREALVGDAPAQVAALQEPAPAPAEATADGDRVSLFGEDTPADGQGSAAAGDPTVTSAGTANEARNGGARAASGAASSQPVTAVADPIPQEVRPQQAQAPPRQRQAAPAQSGSQGSRGIDPEAVRPSTPSAEIAAKLEQERREEAAAAEARRQREAAAAARRPKEVDVPQVSDLPVIQVLSSTDEGQASQLVRRLKGDGHRAFISPVQVDGRTMYRVRVGPFAQRAEAESAATVLKREFKLDTWITTN